MRSKPILASCILVLSLAACQGTGTSTSSTTAASSTTPAGSSTQSPAQVAASGVQLVTAACQAAQPVVTAVPGALPNASASTQATVNDILEYFNAACTGAQAIAAVVAKDPTGGTGTVNWVEGLVADIVAALPSVGALIH